jgi:hypothetical protein
MEFYPVVKVSKQIEAKDHVTTEELSVLLNITNQSIRKAYQDKTFPRKVGNLFNVQEVCDWVLATSKRRSKMWTGVTRFLAEKKKAEKRQKAECKEVPVIPPSSAEIIIPEIPANLEDCDDGDFNNILNGFRKTVNYTVRLCEEAAAAGDESLLQVRIRTSGQALEQLRKAEQSVLDIQTLRKNLLPAEEVRNGYTRLANNVRSKLLQFPVKLAHELVNVSSIGEVQKILTDEIRMILDSFSRNPFGD